MIINTISNAPILPASGRSNVRRNTTDRRRCHEVESPGTVAQRFALVAVMLKSPNSLFVYDSPVEHGIEDIDHEIHKYVSRGDDEHDSLD